MTDINKVAAELMGLELRHNDKHSSNPSFYYLEEKMFCIDNHWNPKENIEQAFMLVEKVREKGSITIQSYRSDWMCRIDISCNKQIVEHFGYNSALSEAITLAFIEAMIEDGKDDK